MMEHDTARELVELAALDALEASEFQDFTSHVATCPLCREALDRSINVASAIGNTVEQPPAHLWHSIEGRLGERSRVEAAPSPLVMAGTAEVIPLTRARSRRGLMATVSSLAAAALVVLSFSLANAEHKTHTLENALSTAPRSALAVALSTPGHRVVKLDSSTGRAVMSFVVVPSGHGVMLSQDVPSLSGSKTYQLWGLVNGKAVSLGVLGRTPRSVAFTMAGSTRASALALSVEPAGGSVSPTTTPIAVGAV